MYSSPTTSSSSHTLKTIVLTGFNKLPSTVNASIFRKFREGFTTHVKLNCLSHYLDNKYEDVCNNLQQVYPSISPQFIASHVKQQSTSMCAALQLALDVHWNAIADKVNAIAIKSSPAYNGEFIVDNIYIVWGVVLKHFETYSQFHTINWLQSLINIKHKVNDDPAKTLESFMVINRHLNQADIKLPEQLLAAYLLNSLPEEMSSVQQQLCTINVTTVDGVFQAMKMFYDSQIIKSNANNYKSYHNNNNDTEKALTLKSTNKNKSECKYFKQGNCFHGDECKFAHNNNGNNNNKSKRSNNYNARKSDNKSGSEELTSSNDSSDENTMTIGIFNDCLDANGSNYYNIPEYALPVQSGLNKLHLERPNEVILDSGASRNTCCTKRLIKGITRVNPIPMLGISSKIIFVSEVGTMKLNNKIQFANTIYVPNASTNLVSVGRLYDAGLTIKWSKTQAVVCQKDKPLLVFKRVGGVYIYTIPTELLDIDNVEDETNNLGVIINKDSLRKSIIPKKVSQNNTTSSSIKSSSPTVSNTPTTSASTNARNVLTSARGILQTSISNNNGGTYLIPVVQAY